MKGPTASRGDLRPARRDRLLRELEHDPYHAKVKLKEPSVCRDCGAIYHRGRWSWDAAPEGAHEVLCPACQRVRDRVPAAFLSVGGPFFEEHREEILNLIDNNIERERAEHPLKRLMDRETRDGEVVFTFTDAHLARGIGEALHSACEGELDYEYAKEDIMLRVRWSR
jgi:NMD protein affecting ribosome stability and mRNA decay